MANGKTASCCRGASQKKYHMPEWLGGRRRVGLFI